MAAGEQGSMAGCDRTAGLESQPGSRLLCFSVFVFANLILLIASCLINVRVGYQFPLRCD